MIGPDLSYEEGIDDRTDVSLELVRLLGIEGICIGIEADLSKSDPEGFLATAGKSFLTVLDTEAESSKIGLGGGGLTAPSGSVFAGIVLTDVGFAGCLKRLPSSTDWRGILACLATACSRLAISISTGLAGTGTG